MGRLQNVRGMSLIELLVAVAILLVGIIPLLGLFLQSLQTVEKANKMMIANNLARDLSEEIRSRAFWDPEIANDSTVRDKFFPNTTVPQPFGLGATSTIGISEAGETFAYGDKRIEKLDDVDDYNGWCRGANCDCTGKPTGLCQNNTPLETYDGKKYGVDSGYPPYFGFTRSVEVYNILPGDKDKVSFSNFSTHQVPVGMRNYTTTFRFFNLQDDRLQSAGVRGTPCRTFVKVIKVTVEYKGKVVPYLKVDDLNLVALSDKD
jgi:prepilin-type N-terminal cleavage/methylation domain-containing protein